MRTFGTWSSALLILVWLNGCGQDDSSNQVELQTEVQKQRAELRRQITGTWARRVHTADSLWEGLRLDEDGRFGLLGIHTMHGQYWLVRADTLVLTTSTERYSQAIEARLATQFPSDDSLILWADAQYLAGIYERADHMGYRITGRANYQSELKLGTETVLYLELRGNAKEGEGKYLASQAMGVDHNRPPFPFHVYYAASDAEGLDEGRLYATLVISGVPTLSLDTGVVVRLGSDVEDVNLPLAEPEL